jgi:hypothetical protein
MGQLPQASPDRRCAPREEVFEPPSFDGSPSLLVIAFTRIGRPAFDTMGQSLPSLSTRRVAPEFPSFARSRKIGTPLHGVALDFSRLRQGRHVPPTTESFDQQHAGVHAAPGDIHLGPLVGERDRLGDEDWKVAVRPALVPVRRELE